LIGALWLVAAVMAYGSIFMLWEHVKPEEVSKDIRISIYFLIGTFLSVLWAGVFFQGHDLRWSLWLAAVLFLYSFWLLIYIWLMKPTAGIFMLPLVVMYGYFFYASVHVAFLNNTPV
jgi:tryptophan-rich sensory protein